MKFVTIDYTNWRGVRSFRYVRPLRIEWASNQWHPRPQWLLVAYCNDAREERTFALDNIHSWAGDPPEPAADELAPIPGDIVSKPTV